jgi:hypothetical protein
MGKRKLNGTSFWQCEWTGLPMKSSHCYWPSWSATGKLIKKGSYCNWESVVAHAKYQLDKGLDAEEHAKIIDHVQEIIGTVVEPAPHYEELAHTKGRMTALDFHTACTLQTHPITAVKISPNGEIFELLVHPDQSSAHTGSFIFADYLHAPYAYHGPPHTFHSMHKKGSKGDRDLSVWYYPNKELQHNVTASNLFKMQLYGDVLLVQQSREQSFMPRERFVSFNKLQFDEQFCKKRKRVEVQCMTGAQYEDVKEKMQQTLNAYEEVAAAAALPPKEMSKAAPARVDGRSLAQKLKARGPMQSGPPPPPQVLVGA